MDEKKNLTGMKNKTSPEYKSVIVCVFLFAVFRVVIFNVQNYYVTSFWFLRNFMKIIQICMACFHIYIIDWLELELSLIKDLICQKIIMQLKYGGSLKLT